MKTKKLICMLLLIFVIAAAIAVIPLKTQTNMPQGPPQLEVSILKVGKADAIILREGQQTMLIDAGEEDDGEEIVLWLKEKGISEIDSLIITHFDKDHVGGADILVEDIKVNQIIVPAYKGPNTEYVDFITVAQEKKIPIMNLKENYSFDFGTSKVLVEPPLSYNIPEEAIEYDNNFSLVTTVTHGENKLLFTGDMEKQRINEWLKSGTVEQCNFIKIPHHGVYTRVLATLIQRVQPDYAAICSSEKNPAEDKTLELLKISGVKTYETKNGNITITSDGKKLQISQG